jgi:hypothetical protein
MFRYVSDVSEIAQNIVKNFCPNLRVAVDATLGNGHDTDFLSSMFDKVYAFDIQDQCITNYRNRNNNNVILINDSHENISEHVNESIDCVMFNLGFLPGGNKEITTNFESTIAGIESSLALLNPQGIMTIAMYPGHEAGSIEKVHVINYIKELPKSTYAVLYHTFINRQNNPPELLVIEKK